MFFCAGTYRECKSRSVQESCGQCKSSFVQNAIVNLNRVLCRTLWATRALRRKLLGNNIKFCADSFGDLKPSSRALFTLLRGVHFQWCAESGGASSSQVLHGELTSNEAVCRQLQRIQVEFCADSNGECKSSFVEKTAGDSNQKLWRKLWGI